jgi:hypothetical protein
MMNYFGLIPHEMTWRQFHTRYNQVVAKEYNCTFKEAEEGHPEFRTKQYHFEDCFDAAKKGIIPSRKVLDSLGVMGRHRIFHDLPDYLNLYFKTTGKAYIEPSVRKKAADRMGLDFRRSGWRKKRMKK